MEIFYISIKNTSNSSYRCKNKYLKLNGILHAPDVKKNLLSIRKLCSDNVVRVEFDDKIVSIKDRETDDVLLTRGIRDGLYHVNLEDLPYANTMAYLTLLHNRMAHFNHQTVLDTIKKFNFLVSSRKIDVSVVLGW